MNRKLALVLIGLVLLMFPAASGVEQYYAGPVKLGPFTWAGGEPIENATVELNRTTGNGTNATFVTYTSVTDAEGYALFDGNISYGIYALYVYYDDELVINGTVVIGDNITIDRLNSTMDKPIASDDEEEFPVVILVGALVFAAIIFVLLARRLRKREAKEVAEEAAEAESDAEGEDKEGEDGEDGEDEGGDDEDDDDDGDKEGEDEEDEDGDEDAEDSPAEPAGDGPEEKAEPDVAVVEEPKPAKKAKKPKKAKADSPL